jgi:hypothetical protein
MTYRAFAAAAVLSFLAFPVAVQAQSGGAAAAPPRRAALASAAPPHGNESRGTADRPGTPLQASSLALHRRLLLMLPTSPPGVAPILSHRRAFYAYSPAACSTAGDSERKQPA